MSSNNTTACTPPSVNVHRCVSILPNDYSILENKPAINGVELTKDTTAAELNLLTADSSLYESITLSDAAVEGLSIIAISNDGSMSKIAVEDLLETSRGIITVDELDETVEIGTYQMVKIQF